MGERREKGNTTLQGGRREEVTKRGRKEGWMGKRKRKSRNEREEEDGEESDIKAVFRERGKKEGTK